MKPQDEFALMRSLYYPVGSKRRQRPDTETLFRAIAGEAQACLKTTSWGPRIRNIERLVSIIRWRMRKHWENKHHEEVMKNVESANRVHR
jgi:hypothetical protein